MDELGQTMLRDEWDVKTIEETLKLATKFADLENGEGMDFDGFMAFVKEAGEMDKMKGGKRGPRMEIHMEENADGSSKMTIIMESARKLAVSATAVAAAAFFA